jgi:hypothetical protein
MYAMTQGSESAQYTAIMERLRADREWLAEQGVQLGQYGPDPVAGKVRVYLAHYSEDAHRVLAQRYGQDIIVDTQSRQWRFTAALAAGTGLLGLRTAQTGDGKKW